MNGETQSAAPRGLHPWKLAAREGPRSLFLSTRSCNFYIECIPFKKGQASRKNGRLGNTAFVVETCAGCIATKFKGVREMHDRQQHAKTAPCINDTTKKLAGLHGLRWIHAAYIYSQSLSIRKPGSVELSSFCHVPLLLNPKPLRCCSGSMRFSSQSYRRVLPSTVLMTEGPGADTDVAHRHGARK